MFCHEPYNYEDKMKSTKEVTTFLRSVNPYQLKDELAIEAYCRRQGLRVRYKARPKNTHLITFEQFVYWFNNDCPLRNDVVATEDGIIGIVKESQFKRVVLGAYLDPGGAFLSEELDVSSKTLRPATHDEKISLQSAFSTEHLSWNKLKSEIVARNIPTRNEYIRITLLGKKIGLGVFREIKENGDVILYCFWEFEKGIRYSLSENLGNQYWFQLEDVNPLERQSLTKELASQHKVWKGKLERIEPFNLRADSGERFYFINNLLEVEAGLDQRRVKNLTLYQCGNYFRTRENCEYMQKLFHSEIKKHPITNRATQGAIYYFINEHWEVQQNTDNDKTKDNGLYRIGNYFGKKETAHSILNAILRERKKQLVNVYIDPPKKRGRPKILHNSKN